MRATSETTDGGCAVDEWEKCRCRRRGPYSLRVSSAKGVVTIVTTLVGREGELPFVRRASGRASWAFDQPPPTQQRREVKTRLDIHELP